MSNSDSKSAVAMAVIGNGFLAVIKLVAFFFSGSGAMFSEAVHSMADTGNQALLYVGIRRSERPATAMFHYGYGADRFFYALMSAVGIFVLGCGVTLYHGIHILQHPVAPNVTWLDFTVLGLGLVVDGFVLAKAVGVINKQRGQMPFFKFVRTTTDPTLTAVLLEDGVACLGILVALAGIGLSQWTGSGIPDGIATLIIGALMGFIAIWLGIQNRTLILGRSLPKKTQEDVIAFLEGQDTVLKVSRAKSLLVGAGQFKFSAEIDWDGRLLGERNLAWANSNWPGQGPAPGGGEAEGAAGGEARLLFCREFGEQLTQTIADEVDRLESELRERYPQLTHLDIEDD